MADQDLLSGGDQPIVDPAKDYFAELVGENKKFKDERALARGKYEADMFIEHKNREFDALREEYLRLREDYNSRAKLEELVDQLSKPRQQSDHDDTLTVSENKPVFDPEQLGNIISSKVQEIEQGKKQEENFRLVQDKLRQRYGSNYDDVVKQQIEELGITRDRLNEMAKKEPKLLIRTLGLDRDIPQEQFQAPPRSQQRSDSFAPSLQKRTWAFYQKMKKEEPARYLDSKTQVQLMRDRAALGTEFEDGDWHAIG